MTGKFYPIYLNYDPTKPPVGRVEIIEENIPDEILQDVAIVPALLRPTGTDRFHIVDFGMILRTNVDTRPREEQLGR